MKEIPSVVNFVQRLFKKGPGPALSPPELAQVQVRESVKQDEDRREEASREDVAAQADCFLDYSTSSWSTLFGRIAQLDAKSNWLLGSSLSTLLFVLGFGLWKTPYLQIAPVYFGDRLSTLALNPWIVLMQEFKTAGLLVFFLLSLLLMVAGAVALGRSVERSLSAMLMDTLAFPGNPQAVIADFRNNPSDAATVKISLADLYARTFADIEPKIESKAIRVKEAAAALRTGIMSGLIGVAALTFTMMPMSPTVLEFDESTTMLKGKTSMSETSQTPPAQPTSSPPAAAPAPQANPLPTARPLAQIHVTANAPPAGHPAKPSVANKVVVSRETKSPPPQPPGDQ